MPVGRQGNSKSLPINIVGSSVFGIYDKMDSQKTYNMTISDSWLVPYPGYKIGMRSSAFNDATRGRGLYESVKLNRIISVFNANVYLITLTYDHLGQSVTTSQASLIGTLQTDTGPVYISENNKPQILISDGQTLYVYDKSLSVGDFPFTISTNNTLTFSSSTIFALGEPVIVSGSSLPSMLVSGITYYASPVDDMNINLYDNPQDAGAGGTTGQITFTAGSQTGTATVVSNFITVPINFTAGYITFHDTYFICAASDDTFYSPAANNTWRLSSQNNGLVWQDIAQTVGLLETKPDNTQAVVRVPSKGNMILVMGETVTEYWFDTGAQLFPYQRTNQGSIDYGCLNPATVASMDEIVVWLARNEKSGPIIMYTTGGELQKVTTDGIDFEFSQLNTPEDAQGFIYRKNGHLFYHINFYTDNISYVVDFTGNKIYNACDQNLNYYSMGQVVWFQNQYFSITKDNGNLFVFDTVFSTYQTVDALDAKVEHEIPRIRVCDNFRLPSQDYFILNDVGFTIETGNTDYQFQNRGPVYLTTEDGKLLITEDSGEIMMQMENENFIQFENNNLMISEQVGSGFFNLIGENDNIVPVTPRVDLSVSWDGGKSFSSDYPYVLPAIGKYRNKLQWYQLGLGNDVVLQFKMWGIGKFVCNQGIANIRQ